MADDRARDLDETRRLILTALAYGYVPAGKEELAGTIINALVYHQHRGGLDEITHLVYESFNDSADSSRFFLVETVRCISGELADLEGDQ